MRWEIAGRPEAPEPPNVKAAEQNRKGMKTLTLKNLTLATPMLGGGVEALKNDNDLPIRGQAIRGQLRFWWRTFQPETDVEALRKKENGIWGATSSASKVKIQVIRNGMQFWKVSYQKNTKPNETELPKYVIFPLDNTPGQDHFEMMNGATFALVATFPKDLKETVESTLKLWLLFGGLGARTRRGMGTVFSPEFPEEWSVWKSISEIQNELNAIIPREPILARSWPSLIGAKLIVKEAKGDVSKNWNSLINTYKDWRQFRVLKNDTNKRHNGKGSISLWPEPNAIRTFHHEEKFSENAFFPRAAYGLPIGFQFKDEGWKDMLVARDGEKKLDRWASPLILKLAGQSKKNFFKICLFLNSDPPKKLYLEAGNRGLEIPEMANPFKEHKLRPNRPLDGNDPKTALLNYFADAMGGDIITLGGGK